jgi:hypothetical protein
VAFHLCVTGVVLKILLFDFPLEPSVGQLLMHFRGNFDILAQVVEVSQSADKAVVERDTLGDQQKFSAVIVNIVPDNQSGIQIFNGY